MSRDLEDLEDRVGYLEDWVKRLQEKLGLSVCYSCKGTGNSHCCVDCCGTGFQPELDES